MIQPLIATRPVSYSVEMVLALLVGLGFGFALERAGFGRADNLAAIFYGRDFRVLRVMFTAIVTCSLGLYILDGVGWLPLSSIKILETFWVTQAMGGFLLGAGFIIGGYCPGTGLVGAVSGKLDAIWFLGGLAGGTLAFSFTQRSVEEFQLRGSMGEILLPEALHLPRWLTALAVLAMALGAFRLAGLVERKVRGGI